MIRFVALGLVALGGFVQQFALQVEESRFALFLVPFTRSVMTRKTRASKKHVWFLNSVHVSPRKPFGFPLIGYRHSDGQLEPWRERTLTP